jgi:hypothetical protein
MINMQLSLLATEFLDDPENRIVRPRQVDNATPCDVTPFITFVFVVVVLLVVAPSGR